TRGHHLAAAEKLYQTAIDVVGHDALDAILAKPEFDLVESVLTSLFTRFRNDSAITGFDRTKAWQAALRFVEQTLAHHSQAAHERFHEFSARLLRRQQLYSQLSPT